MAETGYELADRSEFYRIVWHIVGQIPTGRAATYGQIARYIPPPSGIPADVFARLGPKWVGEALNALSETGDQKIPWHRVVNARGQISLPEYTPAAAIQRGSLRAEGIFDDDAERVDLSVHGWAGPSAAWLAENGLREAPAAAERGSAKRRTDNNPPVQKTLF
jgi:methylated-DNA-protein-cysteine methyltransferase-like protein